MPTKRLWISLLMLLFSASLTAQEARPRPGFTLAATSMKAFSLAPGTRIAWHADGREVLRDERLADSGIPQIIDQALLERLETLGLRFVEEEARADLLLAYTAATEQSLTDQELLRRFGLVPGYPAAADGPEPLERGSLVLYLIEPGSARVVWRCAAQTLIDFDADQATRSRRIHSGIASMLDTLPLAGRQ